MKECARCKVLKPPADFSKRNSKGALGSYCKECQRIYAKEHYTANKTYYVGKARSFNRIRKTEIDDIYLKLKQVPCADCKQVFPPYVMDFDHVMGVKSANVSKLRQGHSMVHFLAEVQKCEVLCSNCHRIRTHSRRAGVRIPP